MKNSDQAAQMRLSNHSSELRCQDGVLACLRAHSMSCINASDSTICRSVSRLRAAAGEGVAEPQPVTCKQPDIRWSDRHYVAIDSAAEHMDPARVCGRPRTSRTCSIYTFTHVNRIALQEAVNRGEMQRDSPTSWTALLPRL